MADALAQFTGALPAKVAAVDEKWPNAVDSFVLVPIDKGALAGILFGL